MPRRIRHLLISLFALGSIACEDGAPRASRPGIAARSLSTVPVVSAELGTDPPILGPSNEVQRYSAVATNGADHLAVWSDARRGGGVWGSRIDADGIVLDQTGFVIAQDHWLVQPEVAFDGSSYVVTWGSQLNPIKGVYASRVTASGLVLDDPPRVISLLGSAPRIARASVGSLLVWNEVSGAQLEIRARLLGQDGKLLGSSATSVTSDGAEVDVAFDGSTHLVVWRAGGQIRAARLSTTASLLDATPIVLDPAAPNGPTPSVAAGASGFLVWWMSELGGRHARVATDGSVLDVPAIESMLGRPDIGFDGSSFLAVLGANGRRIAATGEILGETFPLSSEASSFSRVASKSGEHLVVWDTDTGTLTTAIDIRARRVAGDGALLGPGELTLALAANAQEAPVVTSSGSDFLLAWRDHRKNEPALFFQRIAANGSALDPVATELTLSKLEQRDFAATFDGSQYLVAWHDAFDHVLAARVDVLGNVIDTNAIIVADEPGRRVSAASNTQSSFVVWEQMYGIPADIVGVRVSSSGELLDATEIVIANGPGDQAFPAIASDGTDYLVVWSDALSQEIRANRYAADGSPLTPSPVVVSSAPASRFAPRVAFGNGIYLIAWEDDRNVTSGSGRDVYAARVSSDGTLLDPAGIALGTTTGADHRADVVWNDGAFIVSWTAATELRAARVEPSGAVLDPGGFLIGASGPAVAPARLAANGSGTALISYARYDDSAKIEASRVKTRQIGFVEGPDASVDAGDAASPDAAPIIDADVPDGLDAENDAAAPPAPSPRTTDDGGCGCRTASSSAASPSWTAQAIALALVLAFASRLRRREVVRRMTRFTN